MPRFNEIINNFINGEVSPKVYGRMDSEIYKRSCRELKNMIVYPQGGAGRRVGSQFISDFVPNAFNDNFLNIQEGARVVPFVFSNDEKYLIVFNKYQDSVFGNNMIHYYHVDNDVWKNDFTVNVTFNIGGPQTSRVPDNVSNILRNDFLQDNTVIDEMHYAQAGAYMIFTHEKIPPFVIVRVKKGRLGFGSYFKQFKGTGTTDFGPMPFNDLNVSDVTITTSTNTVGTGRTLTASDPLFNAGHVGSMFAFVNSGIIGIAIVTAFTSSTVVTAEIVRASDAATNSGTKNWYEAAWSDFRGWPRTVQFWQNTLLFGGSPTFPDRIWRSQKFDIFEMSNATVLNPGVANTASDPFYADLQVGQGIHKINFIADSGPNLIVGTNSREISISAFENGDINVRPQTGFGSEYVQPVVVEDTPLYVQRGFTKIREIIFDDRTQGYVSPEITFLAEHMVRKSRRVINGSLEPKIKKMAYQALDNNIVWAIDNNGFLFSCTKSRENETLAFYYHDVGGTVMSMCSLPSKDSTFDEIYMIVRRVINGSTKYFIEKIGKDFYESTLNPDVDERERIPIFSDTVKVFRRKNPNFWAPLKNGVNAEFSDGVGTGTLSGTLTYAYNRAVFSGTQNISYAGLDNADFAQAGCIRVRISDRNANGTIFAISKSNSDDDNLIRLRYNTSYQFKLTVKDATGATIINDVTIFDAGVSDYESVGEMDLELNYDFTNGATRLFINGVQVGTTLANTCTRDSGIGLIRLGSNFDGTDPYAGLLSDFSVYDSVQNTTNFEVFEVQPLGTTVYKLEHLEGEEVQVTANGIYIGDYTVTGGEITIPVDYESMETIVIGIKYKNVLEIQPIDLGSGIGSAMGSIKRVDRAVARFFETAAASIGEDSTHLESIIFRKDSTPANQPIALVTDDKDLEFKGNYSRTARFYLESEAPLPCRLTCVSLRGITADI